MILYFIRFLTFSNTTSCRASIQFNWIAFAQLAFVKVTRVDLSRNHAITCTNSIGIFRKQFQFVCSWNFEGDNIIFKLRSYPTVLRNSLFFCLNRLKMVYQVVVSGLKRSHGRDEYWLELFFWNLCQKRMKLKEKNKLDWSCMKTSFNMYKSFVFFRINVPQLLHWYVNVCHVRHLHGCVCVVFVFFIRHMRSIFFSADAEGCMLTTRPMY